MFCSYTIHSESSASVPAEVPDIINVPLAAPAANDDDNVPVNALPIAIDKFLPKALPSEPDPIVTYFWSSLSSNKEEDLLYEKKIIRIRDEIEDYLRNFSKAESDELAIALAAGRYASMKLAQLTDEESTKKFINECIKTTLKHRILQ